MYVFGRSRRLEAMRDQDLLKDAMFVFEGDFTNASDKKKIVDTVLGLWSLMIAKKESVFEVQLLYTRAKADLQRTFPKEYFLDLPDLLEKQMAEAGDESADVKERRGSFEGAADDVERQSTRFTSPQPPSRLIIQEPGVPQESQGKL